MQALALQPGDVYVECTDEDWLEMNHSQRGKLTKHQVTHCVALCTSKRDCVHVRAKVGSFCYPMVAPVVLLESKVG